MAGTFSVPAPTPAFVMAAVNEHRSLRCPGLTKSAPEPLGPWILCPERHKEVNAQLPNVKGNFASRLNRVRVKKNPLVPGDCRRLAHGLHRSHLVVAKHDGD